MNFHDVLYATLKRTHGNFNFEHIRPETAEYVTKIEVRYRNKLQKLRLKQNNEEKRIFSSKNKIANTSEEEISTINENKKKKNIANPLIRMLFLGMVWNAWSAYTNRKIAENENSADFEKDEWDHSSEELREAALN